MLILSSDGEESKELSGYGSGGGDESEHKEDDVAVGKVKLMHDLKYNSGEENLALVPFMSLGKRKNKQLKEMHVEFGGQISKKRRKLPPVSISNNEVSDRARKSARSKLVKISSDALQGPVEAKSCAVIRAEEVQSNMDPKFPNFIKQMLKSHVCRGFWMIVLERGTKTRTLCMPLLVKCRVGLPVKFCKSHMPKNDVLVTLENERGGKFQMNYLVEKLGLSGGWKNFAVAHNLIVGDVVIFQLIKPTTFKVYIIRANDLNDVDGSVRQQSDTEKGSTRNCQQALAQNITTRKRSKSLESADVQKSKKTSSAKSVPKLLQLAKLFQNNDKKTDIEIITSPSSSLVQFRDIKSFDDFTIMVDELCIDSEIPEHVRAKYYALCSAKNSFLHAHVMQGLNSKLIAGIICEIITIADSLKQCSLTTCRQEFSNWEKALKSFEFLGVSVGFLRARISKLVGLAFESKGAIETRKYMKAKLGRVRAKDEMMSVGSKLVELKETYKKCGGDAKALKSKAESYEHKFREEVDAPW